METVRNASKRSAEEAFFNRNARAPERNDATTKFSSSYIERMMILHSGWTRKISAVVSTPFSPGSPISLNTRSGRKRFRLATARTAPEPAAPVHGAERAGDSPVRRIERGAVTEAVVSQAARAGERLVLGRGAVLTPLARDRARASGVPIEKER